MNFLASIPSIRSTNKRDKMSRSNEDEKKVLFAKNTDFAPLEVEERVLQQHQQDADKEDLYVDAYCSAAGAIVFILGLTSGTFSAVLCKVAYDTTATTLTGTTELFEKPICMVLLMFTGMVPAIFFWLVQQQMLPVEVSFNPLLNRLYYKNCYQIYQSPS